jgi:hypothetical protein
MGTAIFPYSEKLARIVSHAETSGSPVLIVKDQGLYIMTRGLREEGGKQAVVAYAKGCDPSEGGFEWYERARNIAGGDDFGEEIPASNVAPLIREKHGLRVTFSETHLTIKAA